MITVIGATGTVGGALVDELLGQRDAPAVRALVRRQDAARALAGRGVEPVVGDFGDAAALGRALDGAERLFLLSPPGDAGMVAAQARIVDVAAERGVRHVVKLSSIGADEPVQARIVQAHRLIELHVERSGMAWTHLRPHWFMQNELGQAGAVASGEFHAPDVGRISLVDARDVAAAAARVLVEDGHERRAYLLTGPEALSYADIARAFEAVLGHPVAWVPASLQDARASMLDGGLSPVLADGFTEILALYGEGGTPARVSPDLERLLRRPARSFASFVADHADHFARLPAAVR